MSDEVKVVDARGSFCPGPLMELIANIKIIGVGDVLELLSSDKGSAQDVPDWAEKVGHELLKNEEVNGVWHIQIRRTK